jgi:signal transduction histidine kinase
MNRFVKWIYIAFGLSLLILFIMSLNYYRRVERSNYYISSISHTSNTLLVLESVNGVFQQSANAFRNYLITRDSAYLVTVQSASNQLRTKIDTLYHLTRDDKVQQALVSRLQSISVIHYGIRDTLINQLLRTGAVDVNYFIQLERMKANYEKTFSDIRDKEYSLLEDRKTNKDKFQSINTTFLSLLIGFTILIVSVSFIYLLRALKKRIYFERELREKIANLNMTNRELENLSRATSHHIQEPLRKIRNFASLLRTRKQSMTPQEAWILLEKIEANAGNLQTMAQNLVQYANLIQYNQKKELIDLNILIKEVEYHLEDILFVSKAELCYEGLPRVWGIHSQLFILFLELITNAIHFSKDQHPPQIRIYNFKQKDHFTTIVVEDEGQGFSNIYAERIFRLFEQLEPTGATGKGVGLAMCGRIMTNHNGSIRANGQSGKGAKFTVEFPDPKL